MWLYDTVSHHIQLKSLKLCFSDLESKICYYENDTLYRQHVRVFSSVDHSMTWHSCVPTVGECLFGKGQLVTINKLQNEKQK